MKDIEGSPIETAPQDGTLVLLCNDDIFMLGYYSPGRKDWIEWSSNRPVSLYRPLTLWWKLPENNNTDKAGGIAKADRY